MASLFRVGSESGKSSGSLFGGASAGLKVSKRTGSDEKPPGPPILGLKNFASELINIPSGLFNLVARGGEALTGTAEEEDMEFLKAAGKGIARSLLSTATTVADMPFLMGLVSKEGGPVDRALSSILPEDWEPQSFYERTRERGALSAIFEDVGNVALVAGGASAGLRGSAAAAQASGRGARAGTIAREALGAQKALEVFSGVPQAGATDLARGVSAAMTGAKVADDIGGPVFRGTGRAGQLEAQAARVGRYSRPVREFALPAGRKLLEGGEFRVPGTGRRVAGEAGQVGRLAGGTEEAVVPATVEGGRTFTTPTTRAGERAVQIFDLSRHMKTVTKKLQADIRSGISTVTFALGKPLREKLTEMTPSLSRAERSAIIYEELTFRATQGGDEVVPGARAAQMADAETPQFRETQKILADEAKRAEVEAALADADISDRLNVVAREEMAKWEAKRQKTLKETPYRDEGLEGIDSTVVRPTPAQQSRLAKADERIAVATELETAGLDQARTRVVSQRDAMVSRRDKLRARFEAKSAELFHPIAAPDVSRRVAPPAKPFSPFGNTDAARAGRNAQRWRDMQGQLEHMDADIARLDEMLADPNLEGLADYAARLRAEAEQITASVSRAMNTKTKPSQVAPRWQPVVRAMHSVRQANFALYKSIGFSDELANAFLEMDNLTFESIVQRAGEQGFNPVHVREFSPDQVNRLVTDSLTLGPHIREAKTRQARTGEAAAGAEHSLEALAAAFTEVSLELRSAEVLKGILSNGWARNIPDGDVVPDGYVRFRPTKKGLAHLILDIDGGLDGTARDLMMPRNLALYLKWMTKDHSNIATHLVGKVTDPWRALVLTASPKFYFNNAISNVIMASAHGVRFSDWAKAWDGKNFSLRDMFSSAWDERFPGLDPRLRGVSLAREAGMEDVTGSLLPRGVTGRKAVSQTYRESRRVGRGKVRSGFNATEEIGSLALRANEVIDEIARLALYEKEMRTAIKNGMDPTTASARAVEKAEQGLVDYANLSPFERQVVRTFVPFYAWNKGILQMTTRLALDHPARVRAIMLVGQVNNELAREEMEDVPQAYRGLIPLGGGMSLRTQRLNPFADSLGVLDFDTLRQSLNPFLTIAFERMFRADPTGGFGPKELDAYGRAVPRYSVPEALFETVSSVPIASSIQRAVQPEGSSRMVPLFNFAGPSLVDDATVEEAQSRMERSEQQIASGAPLPPRESSRQVSMGSGGSLFSVGKPPSQQGSSTRQPVTFSKYLIRQRALR